MVKKSYVFFLIIAFSFIVSAQSAKIDVSTLKEIYPSGENVSIKVSLLDAENRPIDETLNLIVQDVEKKHRIEYIVNTNKVESVNLGKNAPSGFWTITAKYNNYETTTSFLIESNELAEFSINGNILTITNIGNTQYSKTIQIIIGDVVNIKKPVLEIGESATFRLIAPNGDYNVRITDGKTSLSRGNVRLTGEVIGILDERINKRPTITSGSSDNLNTNPYSFIKQNKLVYFFVLAIIGATILLAIERHYRKKSRGY
ncbi:MAG: hypothetical protein QW727_00610 [Candidatus Pacearchaeota archaeon]